MADLEVANTIRIIGTESQTINIVLKKNEKINVNKNYILYASSENLDEIVYKNVDSLIRQSTHVSFKEEALKKVENESIVRLKNKENNIEYIGLSRGGKIMKISPILYSNIYIRIENILAFNDGTELLKDKEIEQKLNKLIPRNNFQFGFKDLIEMYLFNKSDFCLVKSKLNTTYYKNDLENLSLLNLSSYLNDFVYISGKRNLIEKRLGESETMIIMANSLIAFEHTVTFNTIRKVNNSKNNKYVNSINDIIVEGPGLIIFELCDRKIPMSNPMGNRVFILLTFALLFIEIIAQYFIHYNLRQ